MDLEGCPPLESLDPVLEEVKEDLLSLETMDAGVIPGVELRGERVADAVAERSAVSSVNGAIASSFFEDWFPRRRSDFHPGPFEGIDGVS